MAIAAVVGALVFLGEVQYLWTGMERYHGSMGRSSWLSSAECSDCGQVVSGFVSGAVGTSMAPVRYHNRI